MLLSPCYVESLVTFQIVYIFLGLWQFLIFISSTSLDPKTIMHSIGFHTSFADWKWPRESAKRPNSQPLLARNRSEMTSSAVWRRFPTTYYHLHRQDTLTFSGWTVVHPGSPRRELCRPWYLPT